MNVFKEIATSFKGFGKATKPTEQHIQTAGYDYFSWSHNDLVTTVATTPTGWIQRYDEMINHDSLVRAFATTLQLLMSQMTFSIKCSDDEDSDEQQELANELFLNWGQGDFKHFARQYVSTFLMGYSVFELVLKRTEAGYSVDDLAFHPQVYLTASFADEKTLQGFDSLITDTMLNINRCVYAQGVGNFNHNVYGHSLLRSAYIHYRNKIQIMGSEMYHVKANLEGIPVVYIDTAESGWQQAWDRLRNQLISIKNGGLSGLMLPSATFRDNDGKPSNVRMNDIKLMSVEGSKFIDTNELMKRENNEIARSLMAEFLVMVGQESGSYALSKETTSMFKLVVEGMAQHLCDTFTHQVIKPLWVLNGYELGDVPSLTYDSVDLSLEAMAKFVEALSGAGVVLTESQQDYLFEYAGLPVPTSDERLETMQDTLMMTPSQPLGVVEDDSQEELDDASD